MREILFRGKRVSDGEWIYGHYNKCEALHNWKAERPEPRTWIQVVDEHSVALILDPVDPATVGQFTGLTDKNGKKIFEGDILQNEEGCLFGASYRFRVEFCRGRFYGDSGGDLTVCSSEMYLCEVIGNIYDNPELMEVRDADY